MKKRKVFTSLPDSDENPVAASIRKAIGAGPTDPIAYTSRPRDRHPSWPKPAEAPAGFAAFGKLFEMTGKQLMGLGLGGWDGGLFLFPKEWYEFIPKGFPVETITGKVVKFEPGKTDDDVGFGCLAYGVRIGPAKDSND